MDNLGVRPTHVQNTVIIKIICVVIIVLAHITIAGRVCVFRISGEFLSKIRIRGNTFMVRFFGSYLLLKTYNISVREA